MTTASQASAPSDPANTASTPTGNDAEELPTPTRGHVLHLVENCSVPHDRRVWNEARTLRRAGFRVTVISPMGDDLDTEAYEHKEGVDIYRFSMPVGGKRKTDFLFEYGWAMSASLRLALKVWRKSKFDVMHVANPPDFYFPFQWVFGRKNVRFIFDQHDLAAETYREKFEEANAGLLYKVLSFCESQSYKAADAVIATNESYRDRAITECGVPEDRVIVVRNAPDPKLHALRPPRPELKGDYDHMVMFVGVMGYQDGVHVLLDAAHHVRETLGRTDVLFAIVGTGDQYDDLLAQHERLGLGEGVRFTGFVSDEEMLDYLATADVGVAPDLDGPLNNVSTMTKTMDYMSMGMPVVSFDLKESRYTAGDSAVFVKENNGTALGDAIVELIDDPEKRKRMGEIGYERITGPLSWEQSQAALLQAYNTALR